LTMDAVAAAARASKATLYRRWNGKVALVIDALLSAKGPHPEHVPDTGSLRGDLLATFCGAGGLTDHSAVATFASVLTAISRDAEFADSFRKRFIAPKAAAGRLVFERARRRGELREGLDLDLITPALAGICLHRMFLMGLPPDQDLIARVVDQIILPAALRPELAAQLVSRSTSQSMSQSTSQPASQHTPQTLQENEETTT
jgi:AcrR family transcriptional regulator